jgi:hypothetical protein
VVTELKWYDPRDYNPPWIKALAEGRKRIRNRRAQRPLDIVPG